MKNLLKNIKNFKDSKDGVAGLIVAILLIGLFLSAIAFVQTTYVPQWMQKKESEHLGNVANQFAQLKFSIDTLSVNAQPNSQISVPFTLGSDEIPFFKTTRSYGSLNIFPNDYKIEIKDKNGETTSIIVGSVKFESSNAYYTDQSFIYENGALILSQSLNDVMMVNPTISVDDYFDLSMQVLKIGGLGEKTSASGYGTYPIQAKFRTVQKTNIYEVEEITIITSYKRAWENFLNDELTGSGIDYLIDSSNEVELKITFYESDNARYPNIALDIVEIGLQISPGWAN